MLSPLPASVLPSPRAEPGKARVHIQLTPSPSPGWLQGPDGSQVGGQLAAPMAAGAHWVSGFVPTIASMLPPKKSQT